MLIGFLLDVALFNTRILMYVPCAVGVVYAIPMTCGKLYIGQTGACLNVRVNQHKSRAVPTACTTVGEHLTSCSGCEMLFDRARVLYRSQDASRRLFVEAYCIAKYGDECFSSPSVSLPGWLGYCTFLLEVIMTHYFVFV